MNFGRAGITPRQKASALAGRESEVARGPVLAAFFLARRLRG